MPRRKDLGFILLIGSAMVAGLIAGLLRVSDPNSLGAFLSALKLVIFG